MTLLDKVIAAKRAATVDFLQRNGLIPAEPAPMDSQGIINKLEGEATVLRGLLLECTSIICNIDAESSTEADMLDDLHSKIVKAITGTPT